MRFLGLRLAAVLVVATAMGQASDKNGGPLNRVKRMLQGDTTTTAATAKAFISDHEIQDSWATDPILKSAKRLMNGDHANLVVDMSLGNEVKEIFSDPDTTYAMLQATPLFNVLPGVKALRAKAKEDFTKTDSMAILETYRKFVATAIKGMKDMANPVALAETMQKVANSMQPSTLQADGTHRALTTEERRMTELVARVENGDSAAVDELQDNVADSLWNGAIDLSELKGKVPDIVEQLRQITMDEDPAFFDLITGDDPLVKKVLTDPSMLFGVGASMGDQ
ncbi:hypothetical protein VYU27_010107 [Nannochloropsis oceanica]